ncbi:uncharacterized protein LOC130174272 [Seriola aureovittata]|uniref:uncharacterized protein LOC130174272 n=1 Tax=Seriola aureovittata TaxID=2871759 RepID=UPI0024BE0718|nr:uncharacterized protein LOC130174272 [Seriola aureovittata]
MYQCQSVNCDDCNNMCVVFGGGTSSFREVRSFLFTSEEGREAAVNAQSLNMKVCLTLICCFFLYLQDGSTTLVYSGTEGGDITVQCSFTLSRETKVFCKNKCKEEDILIETTNNRARSGRYSMEYKEGFLNGNVFVTIKQLTKSDSGRYRCRLGTSLSSYKDLEIIVTDALLDGNHVKQLYKRTGGSVTVQCSFTSTGTWKFFCKNQCRTRNNILIETDAATLQSGRYSIRYLTGSEGGGGFLFVTITQLTTSDSGQYSCAQDRTSSSSSHRNFEIFVSDASVPSTSATTPTPTPTPTPTTTPTPTPTPTPTSSSVSPEVNNPSETTTTEGVMLYVGLTLSVMVVLLSVAALIFCRKRKSKPEGAVTGNVHTHTELPVEYASVTEGNRVHEDIAEEGISSAYAYAKYTKPNGVETSDDYSFVSTPSSKHKTEDDSSKLTYSKVYFSNRTSGSPTSVPRGNTEDVIYSVPRVEASSDGGLTSDDSSLYSNVTRHQ